MKGKGKELLTAHQSSMTEWFASVGEEKEAIEFRQEDNTKDDRLEVLYQTVGLKYERPVNFPAQELQKKSPKFAAYLKKHGKDLCALRLIPSGSSLPKLRNRGLTVREVYENWFLKQKIVTSKYTASFRPHALDYPWSIILVIKEEGIFGEMIPGQHVQLTHGDTKVIPTRFRFDFENWQWIHENKSVKKAVEQALKALHIKDEEKRFELYKNVGATFSNEYLVGYFECVLWQDGVVRFSDYNRLLPQKLAFPPPFVAPTTKDITSGACAYEGVVSGIVKIVTPETLQTITFNTGDILVAENTDIRFVPLMQKAGAIVTEKGGILSHASIMARELKVPCVVGAQGAMKALVEGIRVEVDAKAGTVRVLD